MVLPAYEYELRLRNAVSNAHKVADEIVTELEFRAKRELLGDDQQSVYERALQVRSMIEEGR